MINYICPHITKGMKKKSGKKNGTGRAHTSPSLNFTITVCPLPKSVDRAAPLPAYYNPESQSVPCSTALPYASIYLYYFCPPVAFW